MTEEEALTIVKQNCQSSLDPQLTDEEWQRILDESRQTTNTQSASYPGAWKASTPYNIGDVVMPVPRNGHSYRVMSIGQPSSTPSVTVGTSAATQPLWPKTPGFRVTDGSGDSMITWQEDGIDFTHGVWDIRLASYKGWLLKAAKVAACFDFKGDRNDYLLSQKFDHFQAMADRFAPISMA